MKKLSMVVHTSLQQELADLLRSLQLESFMFSHIEEHSSQLEHDPFLSARDKVVGYVPKVRVDVILEDDRAIPHHIPPPSAPSTCRPTSGCPPLMTL